jgi:predicted amidohydrolase YtcJ
MPVESPNPLFGFHAAITRLNASGTSPQGPGGWYPEQKLTREEALKGTINSIRAVDVSI